MRLLRVPLPFFLAAVSSVAWAAPAHAHGGNFKSGSPQGPGKEAPELAGGRVKATTTERATWMTGTWATWWMLNRAAYLPDKRTVRQRAAVTKASGLFQVGRVGGAALGPWEEAMNRGARHVAVPLFVELLDPDRYEEDELVGAALIALGKTATEPGAVPVLTRYARNPDASREVRESAVLGLGLLARSDRTRRFDTSTITRIRRTLLDLLDDGEAPDRIRAFAAFSIGLLASQPYRDEPLEREGRAMTHALWQRLQENYPSADLPVAMLIALGMQPKAGVPDGVLAGLASIAMGRGLHGRKWGAVRRSHALTTYVRLDGPGWLMMLLRTVRGTRQPAAVRAAAAISIARRAADLNAKERFDTARTLRDWLPREPQWFVEGLLHIALGCLLREDVAAGSPVLVERLHVDLLLRRAAANGRTMVRPFTALALGLAVHGLTPGSRTSAELLRSMRAALIDGLRDGRGADDVVGAYAVGVGLAGATAAHRLLLEILRDHKRGVTLRGHCAVALGSIGANTPAVRAALAEASKERISPIVHAQSIQAQALLAPPDAVKQLVAQLQNTRSRYAVAVVAASLGRLGDPAAGPILARLARDRAEDLQVRTRAVVALGMLFDPEPRPARVRMTTFSNYPARTPSLTQLFDIQ